MDTEPSLWALELEITINKLNYTTTFQLYNRAIITLFWSYFFFSARACWMRYCHDALLSYHVFMSCRVAMSTYIRYLYCKQFILILCQTLVCLLRSKNRFTACSCFIPRIIESNICSLFCCSNTVEQINVSV